MSTTESTGPKITDRRELRDGIVSAWTVTEFDDGDRIILARRVLGSEFSVHFSTEQWAAFQKLVVPVDLVDAALGHAGLAS